MKPLIAFAIRHRVFVVIAAAFALAAALYYLPRHPVDVLPDVNDPRVVVLTEAPGLPAEEVEQLVTIPVENEMNGIPRRAALRSISIFGLSVVTIVFDDETDRVYARQQAFERMQHVDLPAGAQPSLSPDSTPVGEIFKYTLKAPPGFPAVELKALEDWVVERKLRQVPGVVDVSGFGGPTKQYQVLVSPERLLKYGLSIQAVVDAVVRANANAGGGVVVRGWEQLYLRGVGLLRAASPCRSIAVYRLAKSAMR